jgi:hypothetical protein
MRLLLTAAVPGVRLDHVLLKITNTDSAAHAVTIAHSTNAQDKTDQVTTAIPATTGVRWVRPRSDLVQSDSTLHLDFAANHVGVITAYQIMR